MKISKNRTNRWYYKQSLRDWFRNWSSTWFHFLFKRLSRSENINIKLKKYKQNNIPLYAFLLAAINKIVCQHGKYAIKPFQQFWDLHRRQHIPNFQKLCPRCVFHYVNGAQNIITFNFELFHDIWRALKFQIHVNFLGSPPAGKLKQYVYNQLLYVGWSQFSKRFSENITKCYLKEWKIKHHKRIYLSGIICFLILISI